MASVWAELLLGYNPNRLGWDTSPRTDRAVSILLNAAVDNLDLWEGDQDLADEQLERITKIDERGAEAAEETVKLAEKKIEVQKQPVFARQRQVA